MKLVWETLVPACHGNTKTNVGAWRDTELTIDDMQHVRKEAMDTSPFDPLRLRNTMYNRSLQHVNSRTPDVVVRCRDLIGSSVKARVIVLFELKEGDPTPWELWARIFAAFGPSQTGEPWRIVWFASPSRRAMPLRQGEPVGPAHINGGYAYPCEPQTVVIYRREEGTRVLIHELLHAACTDIQGSVEEKESETETWAELFLIALLARGSVARATQLWRAQAQWIANQNGLLRAWHGVQEPRDYAWRYTLGRESVLQGLGLALPRAQSTGRMPAVQLRSLRFTSPKLEPPTI